MTTEILIAVISAAGGILAGVFSAGGILAKWLEAKIQTAKNEADGRERIRRERYIAEAERDHALGRLLFWVIKGIRRYEEAFGKDVWNGDVLDSFRAFETAEKKLKDMDREQLADHMER